MMSDKNYLLQIEGDTNDADYIMESTEVSMEDIEAILPVIEAIKNSETNYNWPSSEYADGTVQDLYSEIEPILLDKFRNYCPHGEYGIHTITSISYWPIDKKVKLL